MAEYTLNRIFLTKSKSTTALITKDENHQENGFEGLKFINNNKGIKRKFMEISNKFDLMPTRQPKMMTRAVNRAKNRATLASTPIDFDGMNQSSSKISVSLKATNIVRSIHVSSMPKSEQNSCPGLRKW